MTTLETAGFIVHDKEGLIHGTGASRAEAWDDALVTFGHANIQLVEPHEDAPDDAPCIPATGLRIAPASAALLAHIDDHGGNTAWGRVGGVACTVDEEDAQ